MYKIHFGSFYDGQVQILISLLLRDVQAPVVTKRSFETNGVKINHLLLAYYDKNAHRHFICSEQQNINPTVGGLRDPRDRNVHLSGDRRLLSVHRWPAKNRRGKSTPWEKRVHAK